MNPTQAQLIEQLQLWQASQASDKPQPVATGFRLIKQLYAQFPIPTYVPLLPTLFSLKGKPFTLSNHFTFEPMYRRFDIPRNSLWKTGRQLSKCRAKSCTAPVWADNGQPLYPQDLALGLDVGGLNNSYQYITSTVIDRHTNPRDRIVRVQTRMGTDIKVSRNHPIRTLYGYTAAEDLKKGSRVATMRSSGVFTSKVRQARSRVVLTAYMLGDGSSVNRYLNFTSACPAVLAEFQRESQLLQQGAVKAYPKKNNKATTLKLQCGNRLVSWLEQDQAIGRRAWEKEIPTWVYDLSESDTALFVSRLWATDGCVKAHKNGCTISYTSTSRRLSVGVRSLLLKFGIPSSIHARSTGYRCRKTGERVVCRPAHVVRVETRQGCMEFFRRFNIPGKPRAEAFNLRENNNRDTIPCEIQDLITQATKSMHWTKSGSSLLSAGLRRTLKCPPTYSKLNEYIAHLEKAGVCSSAVVCLKNLMHSHVIWDEVVSVDDAGEEETWDIETDGDHNYILDNLVVHNSTNQAVQGILHSAMTPFFNTIYVTPLFEQIRRFSSNYVRPFINNSPIRELLVGEKINTTTQNVLQRSFKNESIMFFTFCFMDAERTRGISGDSLRIDEIQDINWDHLAVLEQCIAASPFRQMQFSGTPKSKENTMERLWQNSSQAEWIIPCSCGYSNTCSIHYDLEQMIQPNGLSCAKCGGLVHSPSGYFHHTNKDPEKRIEFPGYHVPQVILPLHYGNTDNWRKILRTKGGQGYTSSKYHNEVLGESSDVASRLVTLTDLEAISTLPFPNDEDGAYEYAINGLNSQQYHFRTMGVDWGGGAGGTVRRVRGILVVEGGSPSFTVVTVLGWKPGNPYPDVLYTERLPTVWGEQKEVMRIIQLYRKFRCWRFAHDYGGSGSLRLLLMLQAGFPIDIVFSCMYTGAMHGDIVQWQAPTNEASSRSYWKIDKSRALALMCQLIKVKGITMPAWNSVRDIAEDWLSLVEDKRDRPGRNDLFLITRDPSKSDDFCHSLTFAALAHWHSMQVYPDLAQLYESQLSMAEVAELSPTPDDFANGMLR